MPKGPQGHIPPRWLVALVAFGGLALFLAGALSLRFLPPAARWPAVGVLIGAMIARSVYMRIITKRFKARNQNA
jgi:hypothetical protein